MNFDHIRAAFQLSDFDALATHAKMAPVPRGINLRTNDSPPREAGVLALIYCEVDERLHIILTRRTDTLRGHSGQISFPGGKRDPEDKSFIATALRETCEELGLCEQPITIVGALATVYIPPTHFQVYPTVAIMHEIPHFSPNPLEVAEVFAVPLDDLLNEANKHFETREIQGFTVQIPHYVLKGHQVWGATAVMLSELEHRLRAVLD